MKYLNRIKSVRPLGGYRLRFVFADGYVAELDFRELAENPKGPLEEPLREIKFFEQVEPRDGVPTWPNDYDICADVLRYWCELGRISSKEELARYFADATSAEKQNV